MSGRLDMPVLFRRWYDGLDQAALRAANAPRSVVPGLGAFMVAYEIAGTSVPELGLVRPGVGSTLGGALSFGWLLWLGASGVFASASAPARAREGALLVSCSCVAYLAGCLVVFAEERVAPAIAGLVAMTCAAHGHQGRATLRAPFVSIADALGRASAIAWAPAGPHASLVALGGAGGIVGGIVLGSSAAESARARALAATMRVAVDAQVAAERFAHADELEQQVVDMRARVHDLRNSLFAALLATDRVSRELEDGDDRLAAQAKRAHESVRAAVEVVGSPARPRRPTRCQPVALWPLLSTVAAATRERYPDLEIDLSAVPRELAVDVDEGATGLRRIAENLLVNAAQGDGQRGATRVGVSARPLDATEMVELTFADDGPGFSASQLADGISVFRTTKPTGTGLGLYVADKLARASGGWLEHKNGAQGAHVSVYFGSVGASRPAPSRGDASPEVRA